MLVYEWQYLRLGSICMRKSWVSIVGLVRMNNENLMSFFTISLVSFIKLVNKLSGFAQGFVGVLRTVFHHQKQNHLSEKGVVLNTVPNTYYKQQLTNIFFIVNRRCL